jgi:ribosome-binding protein aMBF1 (putative translation factor)
MQMSETRKIPRIERTPEQKAEELRIREMHRLNPIREVPKDTISNADARQMFKLIAAIKKEREAQGLTVQQLAEKAAVDVEVLTHFEAANSFNPTISILFRIARALGKGLVLQLGDDAATPS